MKIRNIVFSGFAAAILMGTANAATPANVHIASQAYVDSKVSTGLTDANNNPLSLQEALATKADKSDVDDALGEGIGTGEGDQSVAEALAGKVDKSSGVASIGAAATASTEKWASEKAVADAIADLNGGIGNVSQQIDDALGDLGENATTGEENTVEQALALKQNEADSNVASAGNYIAAGHGVASNLTALDTQLKKTDDTAKAATVREINGTNGKALVFNESDGGGTKFEHRDGTWSFAGVNDGGANGVAGQIYAIDSGTKTGTRINVTKGGIYYTNGKNNMSYEAADEIATKRDITSAVGTVGTDVGNMGDLNDGTDSNFGDETDTVVEALNDLDDAINTKQDEITSTNRLASDLVDDTNQTNKFVTADEKAAVANLLGDSYAECIATANSSGHCVLVAGANGLEWVLVTLPYVEGQ